MGLGFIGARPGGPGRTPARDAASAPLAPGQTERWLGGSFDAQRGARSTNRSASCLRGEVDGAALKAAIADVI